MQLIHAPVEHRAAAHRQLSAHTVVNAHDLRRVQRAGRAVVPESDEVEAVTSGELKFSIISSTAADKSRCPVAQIKRKLVRLLSLKDDEAIAALPEIAGELGDLMADSGAKESIRTIAYLLHFSVRGTMESHLALVHRLG